MSTSTSRVHEYLSSIPIITKCLLLFNISIHVVLFVTSFPVNDLAINPLVILVRGEYYRMVSSAFVHGGLMHIAMNMSTLLAIGSALENQYGTIPMLFLTLWCLLLCGATFVCMVWTYAALSGQPGALNTSAVGYSGVLFSYALIEAFHSTETNRSVFGMFSVPTKAYPFILLALIQVLMPNISFWGHLSGLLVGLLLISRLGVDLFMPSNESMVYMEQMVACCRPLAMCSGFVPVREKELVHAYLQCGSSNSGGGMGASCCSAAVVGVQYVAEGLAYAVTFVWQILAHILAAVGVPTVIFRRVEEFCSAVAQIPHCACEYVRCADCWREGCAGCWQRITGAHAYSAVQIADPLGEDAELGGTADLPVGPRIPSSTPLTNSKSVSGQPPIIHYV